VPRLGVAGLSQFTLVVLDIATSAGEQGATVVRTFEGKGSDPYGQFPDATKTEVTTTEAPPEPPNPDEVKKRLMQTPPALMFAPQALPESDADAVLQHAEEKRKNVQQLPPQRLNFFDPIRSLLSRPR